MTKSLQTTPDDDHATSADRTPRVAGVVTPRRHWPGSRAAIGGLLVAIAALIAFWAVQQAGESERIGFVVAGTDLAPGHVLRPGDLVQVRGALDDRLAGRSFRAPEHLAGGVVVRAMAEGELIDQSDVADPGDASLDVGWELGLDLDDARVVAETGDVVDVVAAIGSGESATSEVVASGVRVQRIARPDTFDGSSVTVVLGLDTRDQVLAVSRASAAGSVFVVRTNGASRS